MAPYPMQTIRLFRRAAEQVLTHCHCDWLHVIRYEDMVSDTEQQLLQLVSFLGLSGPPSSESAYAQRIPDRQKLLHPHADAPPNQQRATAWRNELTTGELYALERELRDVMSALGYEPMLSGAPDMAIRVRHQGWKSAPG